MEEHKQLFAELGGFALYDPLLMNEYRDEHNLGPDLLSHLTSSDDGDLVTQYGYIIPILNVPGDYYTFDIIENVPSDYLVESRGWILRVESEEIHVVGIGYLFHTNLIPIDRSLSFSISNGWYELSIISYPINCFGLKLTKVVEKPMYSANMETDYLFK